MRTLIDRYVIWKRRRDISPENDTITPIDLPSHSVSENRMIWDTYDWSEGGEEWTLEARNGIDPQKWKTALINEVMLKYIQKGSMILEIGIGAGRWSKVLQEIGGHVILCDISKKCLDICQKRFKYADNLEYHLIEEDLGFVIDNSIDYIWSYDVFVHINPTDIEKYISDFKRILKPGGYAIIHHSGQYSLEGFRSHMTAEIFRRFVEEYGMEIIEQNNLLPHIRGDIITVFTKADAHRRQT